MLAAFDNYFSLAEILHDDLSTTLKADYDNQIWRRNQIRMIIAMAEAYSHCFREICSVGLESDAPELSRNEKKVILEEKAFSAPERIKYTLKAFYKMFEIEPIPDFSDAGWNAAKIAIEKRGALMHPKSAVDLEIEEGLWPEIHQGFVWLLDTHFNAINYMSKKYLGNAS